ncbi:MAG: hypothetical protein NT007_10430 [Candidatus Kapabacteria bacterium]|nr:hypothetical protein [Candidatus Kapabacteria bacterium]
MALRLKLKNKLNIKIKPKLVYFQIQFILLLVSLDFLKYFELNFGIKIDKMIVELTNYIKSFWNVNMITTTTASTLMISRYKNGII